MSQLQELILQQGLATVSELNRAIFSYPESGVIDAIEQTFGQDRAQGIRQKISLHLGIELLGDNSVKIASDLPDVRAIDFIPLVLKYKGLPIRLQELDGKRSLLVAMADPLHLEAQTAFQNLFRMPIVISLAREKAIVDAYALSAAELSLAARGEASSHPDSNLSGFSRHVEDPEVRKAIQQLIATAVKHNASLVEVDPDRPFTRAHFTFADGMSSSVEISVSPIAVLASLLRRGQIRLDERDRIEVDCRIRFKSVSVNFTLECLHFQGKKGNNERRVLIKNFSIDNPDNPCFWEGLYQANAALVRELFAHTSGVFFLLCQRAASAEFASRAIIESYPDTSLAELSLPLSEAHPLWSQADERRVLAVIRGGDAFDLLGHLAELSPKNKSQVRGIFSYHQLPRVCVFCAEAAVPDTDALLKLPNEISIPKKEFRKGGGCEVCEDRGVLGFVGVSSIFDAQGYAGKLLRSGGDALSLYDALARDCFAPLLEDGVRLAGAGQIPFHQVLDDLPVPPPVYLEKRAAFFSTRQEELKKQDDDFDLKLGDEVPGEHAPEKSYEQVYRPLRGRDVFLSRPETIGTPGKTDDNWILAKPAPEDLPVAKVSAEEQRQTLLVIDDDADQRSILRRVFEIAGYRVEVAADGIDGIISAARLSPGLIIVDFMMPELDGRETIRRLKSGPTTKSIPIVALTAYADPDVELGLLQAGADDFCPKSVSKQVLLKRVERLVKAAKAESNRAR